jgi:iron complex transport system ATP-binding protein
VNEPPTPPALRVRHLSVQYGTRVALHDVDLEVRAGEFLALTGPNGSGKTTLIRAVLGFLDPAVGSVEVFGKSVEELSVRERARQVAWVPQEENLRDQVLLCDYVLYGRFPHHGRMDGETDDERRLAERILNDVGLGDRAMDGVLSLSGGERQRAVLGRALAQETPILLLDEPTAHLDIGHQLDLLARVRALSRSRGVAVVAALHDLNLAARFADRIVVLSRGRRVADGVPAQVLSEDLLARVWGIAADLARDRRTGLPYLVPHQLVHSSHRDPSSPFVGPVHVVGGGGSAAAFLRALTEEGFGLTAGALHLLDSDAEVAEALSIPSAIEAPFAPLGSGVRERHRALLGAARAIVVCPFAVGPSNLANLLDVAPFVGRAPTFLLTAPAIRERDFCGGEAEKAYRALSDAGATEVPDLAALLGALRAAFSSSPSATRDGPRATA